ncbi:MAG: carbohydrate-binding family 25 protein [Clostridiaceae bacterium]|nr:carbohydrate-binding family 25 protein [Clostridiaceae bacterium]
MSIFDNMMMNNMKNEKQGNMKKSSSKSFKEEYSEDLTSNVSRYGIQSYSKSGVSFEKLSETQAEVSYSGLLSKSGAQEVHAVYGFGSNQNWEGISTLQFKKEGEDSYKAIIPIEQGKNINIAFKDSAENWDNNSGMNYTFVN